jgi:hypothetical protein
MGGPPILRSAAQELQQRSTAYDLCKHRINRDVSFIETDSLFRTHMPAGRLFGIVRIGVTYTVSGYFPPQH